MRRGIVSILSALVLVISIGLVIAAQTVTPAQAASSGPNNGGTFVNDSTVGTVGWLNPLFAQSSDNSYATASLDKNQVTYYLKATGFGFSIPVGATINGIEVDVERNGDRGGKINDNSVRLVKNGTIAGDEKSAAGVWPSSDTYITYGGSNDTWGLTWTYSDINNANFGFVISAKYFGTGSSRTASVNHIRITIYYNSVPTNIALSDSSVAENEPVNTVVGTFNTTDPDTGDTFTYTLVSGAGDTDNSSFNINGSGLRTSASFDYETKNSYSIRVRSTDQGGLWVEKQFTITVINVNEAPVADSQSGLSINSCSTLTVTLSGSDPDGDPLTYIISTLSLYGDLYDGTGTGGTHITSVNYTVTDVTHNVTYQPNTSFSGADSFGFKVNDGNLDSDEATISINISGCDDGIACTIDECQNGVCTHTPDDSCCDPDGWYDTGNTQWVDNTPCTEKEQKEQEYRDYYCDEFIGCTHNVTVTQWVDTGNTRNKPDGTPCTDDGIACTIDTCENGQCVHISAAPTVTTSSNSPVSQGATIELTGGPDGMVSYSWIGPGGWTSSLQNPTRANATTAMAGTYTLTVTDSNGCTDDDTTNVVVEVPPPPVYPTITTKATTTITTNSATLNMIYTVGDFSPIEVCFAYKKSTGSAWSSTGWVFKSGSGTYAAPLTGLSSSAKYDFKAQLKYDSTVIEGTTLQFTTETPSTPPPSGGGCFIATAAYGTHTAKQIDLLREFRDIVLLESTTGSQFVALYYQLSPPVADFISESSFLRTLVRELLVDPIVWVVEATRDIWRN